MCYHLAGAAGCATVVLCVVGTACDVVTEVWERVAWPHCPPQWCMHGRVHERAWAECAKLCSASSGAAGHAAGVLLCAAACGCVAAVERARVRTLVCADSDMCPNTAGAVGRESACAVVCCGHSMWRGHTVTVTGA